MVKRTYEGRDNQFHFQTVQNEIFEIFKMFKSNMVLELTEKLATEKFITKLMIFLCCY